MKHPSPYLVALRVLGLIVFTALSAQAQSFVIPLTAQNDSGETRPNLAWGAIAGGNPCIDTSDSFGGYTEAQFNPGFFGVLEVRFVDPYLPLDTTCYDQGAEVDLRPLGSPGQVDTFKLYVDGGDNGYPVHLTWDQLGLNSATVSCSLMISGIPLADMRSVPGFDITVPSVYTILMERAVAPGGNVFTSLTPTQVFDEDPLKLTKSKKPAKRVKAGKPINTPNWGNVLSELVAQGGFQPGTSESDSGGGLVIGITYMFEKDPAKNKWAPVKDSANLYHWVRLSKWDGVKNIGKSHNALQKTLQNKTFKHLDNLIARGFDSTLVPGAIKRKQLKKQATKLDPKKTPNPLFAELVALKVNIAASALGKTPAGFGELVFDRAGNPFDDMVVKDISLKADSMMTFWKLYTDTTGTPDYELYDSLHSAVQDINVAFSGAMDTASWQNHANLDSCKLVLDGVVDISTVSYMQLPSPFVPTIVQPTNNLGEAPEDFEDADYEEDELVPSAVKLFQNFPNPFNPTTNIAFNLVGDAQVTVGVYNMLGQQVGLLVDGEEFDAGVQTIEFDASELASGVYFYRVTGQNLETGDRITPAVGKMLLLK